MLLFPLDALGTEPLADEVALSPVGPNRAELYTGPAAPLVAFLAVRVEPAPIRVLLEGRAFLAFVATTIARRDILLLSDAELAAIVADGLAALGAIIEISGVGTLPADGAFELDDRIL